MSEKRAINSRSNSPLSVTNSSSSDMPDLTSSPETTSPKVVVVENATGRPVMLMELDPRVKERPSYASPGSIGCDLAILDDIIVPPGGDNVIANTGVSVAVPAGKAGLLFPRSSLFTTHRLELVNACLDRDFNGQVHFNLINHGKEPVKVEAGRRLGQLVIVDAPEVSIVFVDKLPATGRSEGFGAFSGP